ncbi:Inactive TPR repeat-containing thioredoxin TTL3 [Glycine soja]|uniref:Inactive TPR repeat-containing thioredoxin TTL3 n=1 Tax=Glycine soja TaxID=3848 RepID=A0A445KQA9_GLYSO|nr:Inactive TPR repeat-containing thioredoxin TTL3 [Glycine soja]
MPTILKSHQTPLTEKKDQGGCEDVTFSGTASSNNSSARSGSKPLHMPNPVVNRTHQRNHPKVSPREGYVNSGRRVPKEAIGISGELESMITDRQKGSSSLVRASSSNVMMFGNLGNLRQGGNTNTYSQNPVASGRYTNQTVENVSKGNKEQPDALALYDAAIAIHPNKASYRSNRSAALTALGRLLEAVFECREAIQIEPRYKRAHYRLGNLNMSDLTREKDGEMDKALYHYKQAGPEADTDQIAKVKKIQVHLNKCTEARRLGDWNKLIKETNYAVSFGADSAPHIFALQAEAFLMLRRHQHAEEAMLKGSNFDVDHCIQFFGPICNANTLVTQAWVHLAAGRAVAAARSNRNELFKASKFSEACVAYGEGLENDPYNSVLLCNRAACRSKTGQLEKAMEDCNAALSLHPSYSKARLRRADCNAKLKRWETSIQDYEILLKETPEDEELRRTLLEAKSILSNSEVNEGQH